MAVEEKKNVLFVCSCLQSDLLLQQSIVLVSELISNLCENCNVFVLTNTDTLKLVLDDNVKFYVAKITEKSISEIVRKEKITKIFPILSDAKIEKMMSKILQEKRNKKLNIFHSDYLLSKRSKSNFRALAKKAGFTINNKKELDDLKDTRQFCAVCINDKCKNQIVLDVFEYAIVNSKKLFCTPVLGQTLARRREISQILQNFGELIGIKNYPYCIHFSIDKNWLFQFDDIKFGITHETIFAIQRQRLSLGTIIAKMAREIPCFCDQNRKCIAYAYDYEHEMVINYAKGKNDVINLFEEEHMKVFSNSSLARIFCQENNKTNKTTFVTKNIDGSHFNFPAREEDFVYETVSKAQISGQNILIFFDLESEKDISSQIVFIKLCQTLKEKTKKNLILLTRYNMPITMLASFKYIHIYEDLNAYSLHKILKQYNLKYAFLNQNREKEYVVNQLKNDHINIYGLDYGDSFLYQKENKSRESLLEKLGMKYNEKRVADNVFCFYCIKDRYGNVYLPTIVSSKFNGELGAVCNFYPAIFPNYDTEEDIATLADKIIANMRTAGIVELVFDYNNGDIVVYDVSSEIKPEAFFFHNLPVSLIYEILTECLLEKNIDTSIRKNKIEENTNLYQRIVFSLNDDQNIKIEDITNKKIFEKFKLIFAR